jgi:hypothetical protein
MITKFDEFIASPIGSSITRNVEGVQLEALKRIVRVCGKMRLNHPVETVRSVFDKMLVRSLSFLATDELVRYEAERFDAILDGFGNSANNKGIPVVDQFRGTKEDVPALGVAMPGGKNKPTHVSNLVEGIKFDAEVLKSPLFSNSSREITPELLQAIQDGLGTANYVVTVDEGVDTGDVLTWLAESGFSLRSVYPFGVVAVTGPAGVVDMPGAAIHEERTAYRIHEAREVELTLDQVRELPAYQDVLAQGYILTSSPAQLGRLTLQFGDRQGHRYIVYQNGAVRSLTATNAATNMKRFDALNGQEDWSTALGYVANLLKKKTAKAARQASGGMAVERPASAAPAPAPALPVSPPAARPAQTPPPVPQASRVEAAPVQAALTPKQVYDAIQGDIRALRAFRNSLEVESTAAKYTVQWRDQLDFYDWVVPDDTLSDPDHEDEDFEDWDSMEPAGPVYRADVAAVRAAQAKYPDFRIHLTHQEKYWMELEVEKR